MPFSTSDDFANWVLNMLILWECPTKLPQDGGTVIGEDGEGGGGIIPNTFITSTVRGHFSSFGEIKLNIICFSWNNFITSTGRGHLPSFGEIKLNITCFSWNNFITSTVRSHFHLLEK